MAPCVRPALVPLLLLPLGLTACGDRLTDGPDRDVHVRDSAGVLLTTVRAEADLGPVLVPEPLLTLDGSGAGAGFGDVRDVAVGPRGRIHVLDLSAGRVTVWTPAGTLVRSFGRRGEGPGEFVAPSSVHVLGDGRVLVGEMMPTRLHWFGRDGTHLRTIHVRPPPEAREAMAHLGEWQVTRSGVAVARLSLLPGFGSEGAPQLLVRVDTLEGTVRVLARWEQPLSLTRPPVLFGARWRWTLRADGSPVLTPGERLELRYLGPRGRLRRVVRKPGDRVPVGARLRRRAVEEFLSAVRESGAPSAMVSAAERRLEVADALPAVQGLWSSTPGEDSPGVGEEVWVAVPGWWEDDLPREIASYEVFGPEGRPRISVAAPARFTLEAVQGRLLYGVWRDTLDVEFVRVYRVPTAR